MGSRAARHAAGDSREADRSDHDAADHRAHRVDVAAHVRACPQARAVVREVGRGAPHDERHGVLAGHAAAVAERDRRRDRLGAEQGERATDAIARRARRRVSDDRLDQRAAVALTGEHPGRRNRDRDRTRDALRPPDRAAVSGCGAARAGAI